MKAHETCSLTSRDNCGFMIISIGVRNVLPGSLSMLDKMPTRPVHLDTDSNTNFMTGFLQFC